MMEIFRNMLRRKGRTILTITGITVGIFAFTVMGSMALRFNKIIGGGKRYITGQITVIPKGSSFGDSAGAFLPLDTINKIAKVDGVQAVAGGVSLPLVEPDPNNPTGGGIGQQASIQGMDLESAYKNRNWTTMQMKEGHMLEKGDAANAVAIGYTVAADQKLKVNDTMKIRGKDFTVIGVLDQTLTGPDQYVFMPIAAARQLLIDSTPFLKSLVEQSTAAANISAADLAKLPAATRTQLLQAKAFKVEDLSQEAAVSWKDGQDSETVANRIKDQFKNDVIVLSPTKLGEQIDNASAIFNAIILGSAVIALIVGGFSIINTMIMSISERKREIGIKKAIGASNRSIAWDYTLEAGVIGIVGGLVGLGIGVVAILFINHKTAASGAEIFLLNPTFMIGVVAFSFVLGVLAGLIPALRASRMKVVDAIREL